MRLVEVWRVRFDFRNACRKLVEVRRVRFLLPQSVLEACESSQSPFCRRFVTSFSLQERLWEDGKPSGNPCSPLVAIPDAHHEGAKFFRSINMPEVVTRTVYVSSRIAACW